MEIVINADDFGMSREVNEAIAYCFSHKLIQRTSLMVNMPCAEEAVSMAKEAGFENRMGLHLNLVAGKPLTECIRTTGFCDANGRFNGLIMKGKKRFFLSGTEMVAVREEIDAQIEKYLGYGYKLNHLDSHRHAHTNYSVLLHVIDSLSDICDCAIRLSRNMPEDAMSGGKGLYKTMINKKIKKFNRCRDHDSIDRFGGIGDYERYKIKSKLNQNIEIMVHPIMRDGKLADAINNYSVEEWLQERK